MGKYVMREVPSGVKFDLRAANGGSLAASEVYETRAACLRGIASVRGNAAMAKVEDQTRAGWERLRCPKFEVYMDKSGDYRFRLKARNGAIVAVSGAYTSRAACLLGIESVRANAPDATVENLGA